MKILNNKKIYQALFILVFSLVFNWVFNTQLSFAKQVTLNRNQVSTVFETNNIRRRTQGGTITKKYYVYSDWPWEGNDGVGIIHFINRSNGRQAFQVSGYFGHMASLDHKWGSQYVYIHNGPGCIDMSKKRSVDISKCPPKSTRRIEDVAGRPQAQAPYFNGYYFQGSNIGDGGGDITVFDKTKKKKLATYSIPGKLVGCNYRELEAVMIDKDTGDVYAPFNCERSNGSRYMKILKVKASAFGKYTKVETEASKKTTTKAPAKPKTAIIKTDNIQGLLQLVLDILVIGIPILGFIGISIVGIQYLTAGGDENKTRKAKRRMLEIIVGLVLYAVTFILLEWLGIKK